MPGLPPGLAPALTHQGTMNTPLFLRTMLAAALVFFGVFSLTTPAVAEGEAIVTWSVSPSTPGGPDGRTRFDFQAAPSSVISDWVAVTNDSAVVATFSVYAADATTDFDTAAFTLIGSDEESIGAGAWIALDASEITLDPGERANIPFTMTVPQDATPGDHAAGIVAVYTTVPSNQHSLSPGSPFATQAASILSLAVKRASTSTSPTPVISVSLLNRP